jgi:outer membrane protein assembly factor BamE (lipoprotein component of BamABCDE complex)
MHPLPATVLAAAILLAAPGCIAKDATQGVRNLWRSETVATFEKGVSTQEDVLKALGPPSQLIALGDQTVFYYLLEMRRTRSAVLIVYNRTRTDIRYDRAIFFFDKEGRLTEFSTSHERAPPPK